MPVGEEPPINKTQNLSLTESLMTTAILTFAFFQEVRGNMSMSPRGLDSTEEQHNQLLQRILYFYSLHPTGLKTTPH